MKDEEFLREQYSSLTPKKVAVSASFMLDKIQTLSTAEQIAGIATLFILVCAKFGLTDYGNILNQTHNYIFDNCGTRLPFKGVERYMQEILK